MRPIISQCEAVSRYDRPESTLKPLLTGLHFTFTSPNRPTCCPQFRHVRITYNPLAQATAAVPLTLPELNLYKIPLHITRADATALPHAPNKYPTLARKHVQRRLTHTRNLPQAPAMRALAALLCLACAAAAAAVRRVARFDLVNADTGERVRALRANDTIAVSFPFTIVAVTAGESPVSSVTFAEPHFQRERIVPYALGGDYPPGQFRSLTLKNGPLRISAYVDEDSSNAYTIPVTISRPVVVIPEEVTASPSPAPKDKSIRGPVPGEAAVDLSGKPELPIPVKLPGCKKAKPTWKGTVEFNENSISIGEIASRWLIKFEFCFSQDDDNKNKIRVRLLSYREDTDEDGVSSVFTKVLQQQEVSVFNAIETVFFEQIRKVCSEQVVYAEFCAKDSETNLPLCGTSPLQTVPALPVPEPRLKHRPPIHLKLAPGDNFVLTTSLNTSESLSFVDDGDVFGTGFANSVSNDYTLVAVLEHRLGDVTEKTKASRGLSVVNNLRAADTKKVSATDNGALLYVEYAEGACPTNFDNTRERYNTTILVDESYSRLIKQDNALPEFKTPIYPETPYKEAVEVTVDAQNVGGGKRYSEALQSEQPTELHYQWYLRTAESVTSQRTYAEALPGQTSPTLTIESADCDQYDCNCGKWGCFGLLWYYVDVCNTFGCRRSDVIKPRVLPPRGVKPKAGEKWDDCYCHYRDENRGYSYLCTPRCILDGVQ